MALGRFLWYRLEAPRSGNRYAFMYRSRAFSLATCHWICWSFLLISMFAAALGTITDVAYDHDKSTYIHNQDLGALAGDISDTAIRSSKKELLHFSKQIVKSKHDGWSIEWESSRDTLPEIIEDEVEVSPPLRRSLQGDTLLQTVETILVVSTDGKDNHFVTVQAAVDAVPMWNSVRWIIYVQPGIYYGTVTVPRGKDYVTLLGEDSKTTTLSCQRSAKTTSRGIMDSPCVIVEASNFVAKNIAFENTSPKPAAEDFTAQAPAIRISGDNCSFYGCSFLGWQDTLYADQGRHYYKDCRIEGSVDFILGYARAVFDNCTIYSRSEGFITAQSRWCDSNCTGASSAFVFTNCTLIGLGPTYLGRPWREYAKVLYINTWMGPHIVPQGWHEWVTQNGTLYSHNNTYFGESNSLGPGANPSARALWSHQIEEAEVEANSYQDVKVFLEGETWLESPPSVEEVRNSNRIRSLKPFSSDGIRNMEQISRSFSKRRVKYPHS